MTSQNSRAQEDFPRLGPNEGRSRPRAQRVRRLCGMAIAFASVATLGACGFTPMYATPGVSAGLSAIDIKAPQGRVGFLLRQDLDDALGHDKLAAPRWRMEMSIDQTRDPRGLTLQDVAERYVLGISVTYKLIDAAQRQGRPHRQGRQPGQLRRRRRSLCRDRRPSG